jgi:hypothetical protein
VATLPLLIRTLLLGAALGVAFNPLASAGAALMAGLLYGSPDAHTSRRGWAVAAVAAAWLLGDGFRVLGRLRDALDGAPGLVPHAPAGATVVLLAVWALVGLVVGYALPAVVAVHVGHGVVRGTGWLSAVAVGLTASLALAALSAPLSAVLQRLVAG